nr:uncharacterized protein LOC105709959 [Aotus nancymaae]
MSIAHKLPAQGPQISCLHSDLQVSAPVYCKLGAFLLQNTRPLARKPWNFPSKESSATPGLRKVTNGQTRSKFEEEAPALPMLSGSPPKGTGNRHKQDPEHPGSVWAAGLGGIRW